MTPASDYQQLRDQKAKKQFKANIRTPTTQKNLANAFDSSDEGTSDDDSPMKMSE